MTCLTKVAAARWVAGATGRSWLRRRLREAAFADPLTGLPNRAWFDHELATRFAAAGRGAHPFVAMLLLDLDGFKRVNDTSGHAAGDELLAEAGARIRAALGPGDLAARLGGDEFTVLMQPGSDEAAACELADALLAALAGPFTVLGEPVLLGASIGVACAAASAGPLALVRGADLAMYRAKDTGRGRSCVFEDWMLVQLQRRVGLEQRLRQAVLDDELSLVYQPVVDLRSGAVVSVEALVRWTEGATTVMEPEELVALAESAGRIDAIGAWVLERAVGQASGWAAAGYPVRLAVNVSVRQLADPGLPGVVDRALRAHGVPPDRLTLEVTETVLLEQAGAAISTLERLRGLGVHLAVDDFGTGYSSLGYLRRLPVGQLKVDRGFLKGFGQLADVTALLRSMVDLGLDLGLTVTVEGIENGRQLRLLRELGVHTGQGYVFARPLDADSMLECLQRGPFVVEGPDDVKRLPRVADQWRPSDTWTSSPDRETDGSVG